MADNSLDLRYKQDEQPNQLPRAIAKEKNGIVLYWVEELGIAGLHRNGLARLFGCSEDLSKRILDKMSSGKDNLVLDVEIVTPQGLQRGRMLSESGFGKFARLICESKTSQNVKDKAWDLTEKFAAAGFKLMVMLELAPAELAARAVSHLEQEIELERLRNEGRMLEAQKVITEEKLVMFRHTVVTTMPKAIADRVLGVTEVRDIEYRRTIVDNSGFVLNAGNTKTKGALCEEFGFVTRSGKPDYKAINALVEDAIACGAIPNPWREVRTLASLEFDAELVPNLKKFYESSPRKRQLWLGETSDKTGVNRE